MASAPDQPFPERFPDEDDFYRRIPPDQFSEGKIHSNAFGGQRLSVNWSGRASVDSTLEGFEGFGVASITAGICYQENQAIEPTPIQSNSAHCEIVGPKPRPVRRRLRKSAILLREPEPD